MPLSGTSLSRSLVIALDRLVVGCALLTEVIKSRPAPRYRFHGPAMVKPRGCPFAVNDPTRQHVRLPPRFGMDTVPTAPQCCADRSGCSHWTAIVLHADPVAHAAAGAARAATITANPGRPRIAERRPVRSGSMGLSAGRHVTTGDVDDAGARRRRRGPRPGPGSRHQPPRAPRPRRCRVRGVARRVLSDRDEPQLAGATPENPSGPGCPAISPPRTPWLSQVGQPVGRFDEAAGSTLGRRGPVHTAPITATVCPSPRLCRHARRG